MFVIASQIVAWFIVGVAVVIVLRRVDDEVQEARERAQAVSIGAAKYGLHRLSRVAGYYARGDYRKIVREWFAVIDLFNGPTDALKAELHSIVKSMAETPDGLWMLMDAVEHATSAVEGSEGAASRPQPAAA